MQTAEQYQQQAEAQVDAGGQQYDQEQATKSSQEALNQSQEQPSFIQKWMGAAGNVSLNMLDTAVSAADQAFNDPGNPAAPLIRAGRDVASGVATGVANTMDAVRSAANYGPRAIVKAATGAPDSAIHINYDDAWDHGKAALLDFRDAAQVKDPTLADNLTQGAAQLAIPFAGYSRALAEFQGFANVASAGIATDATALEPHAMRMADLLALGRHTEGKLGSALQALAPDGSGLNAYINYLTDRGDETEAQGRFKNVLDGFGLNLIATPLLHAAGVALKQGMSGINSALESGVSKTSDLLPPTAAPDVEGFHGTPHDPDFFDNAKIGSGEGAQLYGHGHYIAENAETAQHYATTLSANGGATAALKLARATVASAGDARSAVVKLNEMADNATHPNDKAHYQAAARLVKSGNATAGVGNVIKVGLNPDDVSNMLDWDKPLAEQPGVAAKLGAVASPNMTGKDVHRALEKLGMSRPEIAQQLGAAGIPGIKYLDAGSRADGEGTRNFVVFDGKNIKITGKSKGK